LARGLRAKLNLYEDYKGEIDMADAIKKTGKKFNGKKPVKKKVTNPSALAKGPAVLGKAGDIEYKMSRECAEGILKDRKGPEAKIHPQTYLCQYVNEQYGLLGNCVKVIIA
jgi:hypothetical protein